jgi:hypothetical protein
MCVQGHGGVWSIVLTRIPGILGVFLFSKRQEPAARPDYIGSPVAKYANVTPSEQQPARRISTRKDETPLILAMFHFFLDSLRRG